MTQVFLIKSKKNRSGFKLTKQAGIKSQFFLLNERAWFFPIRSRFTLFIFVKDTTTILTVLRVVYPPLNHKSISR